MEKTIGVTIHNRFDFEVTDASTGELKQTATAYNIILDQMWLALCYFGNYFNAINVGQGTGTLAPTRTSLFSQLGAYAAVTVSQVMAVPTCYNKKKIVLAPEALVGKVISEVGISNDSGLLVTHALLQDSEGNPITITKTATDIVTIYATVFSSFAETDEIKLIGMPSTNPLLRWLSGLASSFSAMPFMLGSSDLPTYNRMAGTGSASYGAVSPQLSGTVSVANKKVTTGLTRFDINTGNGHLKEICFGQVARLLLPSTTCPARVYTGVTVGAGDGVKTRFMLPSKNVDIESVTMFVNGVETPATKSLTKSLNFFLAHAPMSPGNGPRYFKRDALTDTWIGNFSGNLAWGKYNNGYLTLTTVSTTIGTMSANYLRMFDISPVESLLAIPCQDNYVRFFDISTGIPIVSAIPAFDPGGTPLYVKFSPDGQHLAVAVAYTKLVRYKRNGTVFEKLPEITGDAVVSNYAYDYGNLAYFGDLLVMRGVITPPYLTVQKRVGDTYVPGVVTGEAYYPGNASSGNSMCMNDAHTILLLAKNSTDGSFQRYDVDSSGNATKVADVVFPGMGTEASGVIENIGGNLYLIYTTAGTLRLYSWDGVTSPVLLETMLTTAPAACTVITSFVKAAEGIYETSVRNGGASDIALLDTTARSIAADFATAPAAAAAVTANYTVNGIHKTNQYVIDMQVSIQFGEGV